MPPNRRPRRSPGALPLTSERDLYISLMSQGVSNAAACRIVGVNRQTGHRWRYGRSITIRTGEIRTYPAITRPAHPVSARFLSEAERIAIADGLIRGGSIRVIAAELGRAPSTVSREIRRNRDTRTEVYHPFRAQRRAAGGPAPPARRFRLPLAKSAAAGEGAMGKGDGGARLHAPGGPASQPATPASVARGAAPALSDGGGRLAARGGGTMTPGVEARMIAMFRRGETAAFKREQLAAVREIERGGLIAEAVAPLVGEIKRLRAALTTAYTLMVERGAPQEDVEPWLACLDTLAALAPKEADPDRNQK